MKTLRKFSPEDVGEIKNLRANGLSYRKIAERFNCAHVAIYQILKGGTYQDLS
ncbi:MAG: helix-turn-helix domain-containing protein [Proteobacteria bacterium]|nr:helix-turn-helix domain-containing protein [Pseudomonadota bacterium]